MSAKVKPIHVPPTAGDPWRRAIFNAGLLSVPLLSLPRAGDSNCPCVYLGEPIVLPSASILQLSALVGVPNSECAVWLEQFDIDIDACTKVTTFAGAAPDGRTHLCPQQGVLLWLGREDASDCRDRNGRVSADEPRNKGRSCSIIAEGQVFYDPGIEVLAGAVVSLEAFRAFGGWYCSS